LPANVVHFTQWNSLIPKVTVQYQVFPDLMSYATVSRGFKGGGYSSSTTAFVPFDPEYLRPAALQSTGGHL
jgi:outer membrane receptor protein involved in Fe transport